VEESIGLICGVLEGKSSSGVEAAARTVVVMNAAAALMAVGRAQTLEQAAGLAVESIDSGRALEKLESLATLSQKLAAR
jgi:anthranilate phosphoribosyltransferase